MDENIHANIATHCQCQCGLAGCASKREALARLKPNQYRKSDQNRRSAEALKKAQIETAKTATRKSYPWTSSELELLERADMTAKQIAFATGRTIHAVRTMRIKARREPKLQRILAYQGHQEALPDAQINPDTPVVQDAEAAGQTA